MPITRSARTARCRENVGRRSAAKVALSLALVVVTGTLFATAQAGEAGLGKLSRSSQVGQGLSPSNQPALDAAADDAQTIAGSAYYTSAVVDDAANTVTVYLADAPQTVLDALTAAHPGIYIFNNAAQFPWSRLTALQEQLNAQFGALANKGVGITRIIPTTDGRLDVYVQGDPATATSVLNTLDPSSGAIRVLRDDLPPITGFTTTRYNDFNPWNGGDFIYHKTSDANWDDCSSGFPVVNSAGQHRILTAAHCFYSWGNGIPLLNGYVRGDNATIYSGSSQTTIGSVTGQSAIFSSPTDDVALYSGASSSLMFNGAWNGTSTVPLSGVAENHLGDLVCTSGAMDGEICNLQVTAVNTTQSISVAHPGWGPFVIQVNSLDEAVNPNGGVAAGAGDSGGPVYSKNAGIVKARGIIEGGTNGGDCPTNPTGMANRVCSVNVYYTGMSFIERDWNLTVG